MELGRRELITAFLGGAVAASCKSTGGARKKVPGELVDRVVETGHLLRGGPLPVASNVEALDVLIIGAGAAGLSAAWRLAAAGVTSFKVIEVDAEAGGTARSGANAVSAYPWGAHYLPAPLQDRGPVMKLLRELGAVTAVDDKGRPHFAEEMLVHEPDERLFYKGAWYEGLYLRAGASPRDLEELRRFEAQMDAFGKARDGKGRKAFAVPLDTGSDDAEWTSLDKLSMAEWFSQQGYRSPRLKWMVDYACRDDYGAPSELISAYAGIWYFAARNEGQGDRSEGYLAWPEGNGRLIHHLRDAAGTGRIFTKLLAHTVIPDEQGCTVHAFDAAAKTPVAYRARHVVLAVPRFVAKHIVAPWRSTPPEFLSAFQTTPWVVANLTLSSRPTSRGFPLCWDNVFYESKSL
ncbi:MAG: FAD-dependent oxidoreductase, partial [Myxococcaceae bacterium]